MMLKKSSSSYLFEVREPGKTCLRKPGKEPRDSLRRGLGEHHGSGKDLTPQIYKLDFATSPKSHQAFGDRLTICHQSTIFFVYAIKILSLWPECRHIPPRTLFSWAQGIWGIGLLMRFFGRDPQVVLRDVFFRLMTRLMTQLCCTEAPTKFHCLPASVFLFSLESARSKC